MIANSQVAFRLSIGLSLLVLSVAAMALTPEASNGLPKSDYWTAFLLYVLGPAGVVALSLAPSLVWRKRAVALLVTPVAYLIGVAVSVILAVNFGVVAP
jgi:hypothetical protein